MKKLKNSKKKLNGLKNYNVNISVSGCTINVSLPATSKEQAEQIIKQTIKIKATENKRHKIDEFKWSDFFPNTRKSNVKHEDGKFTFYT